MTQLGEPTNHIDDKKTVWIAVHLQDQEGNPISGEKFQILQGDRVVYEGVLNKNGFARVSGIDDADYRVSFPALHGDRWE